GPNARSIRGIVDRWVGESSMMSLRWCAFVTAKPQSADDARYGNILGRSCGLVQSILPIRGRGNALATSLLVNQLRERGQLIGRADLPFLQRPCLGPQLSLMVAAAKGLEQFMQPHGQVVSALGLPSLIQRDEHILVMRIVELQQQAVKAGALTAVRDGQRC